MTDPTDESEALLRLVTAAINAHRDQHRIYGSTATCSGGIGGQAMTAHCSIVCYAAHDRHAAENAAWEDVERAFFHRQSGRDDWADFIPGGPQSQMPAEARA